VAIAGEPAKPLAGLRVAVMSKNKALREGLYLQIAVSGGIPADPGGPTDAVLIDAGTSNVPELTVHPDPAIPALVLLTPNARGSLEELRSLGFAGYLVKPVRQPSLVTRLLLCCEGRPLAVPVDHPQTVTDSGPPPLVTASPAPVDGCFDAACLTDTPHTDAPVAVKPSRALPPGIKDAVDSFKAVAAEAPPFDSPDFDPPAIPAPFMENHPAAARSAGPAMAQAPSASEGLRILLAEDNPINMMLIRELLRRRGHKVTEVTTGNDAVQAMLDGRYDLLLTDIHMPGMDGIEATRAIRAGEVRTGRARTPIVALTADSLDAGKRACQEAGMDGFLTKPVDPAELEEMFLMLFPGEEGSHIVAA
jgi:CheY-like chemotaxis protein